MKLETKEQCQNWSAVFSPKGAKEFSAEWIQGQLNLVYGACQNKFSAIMEGDTPAEMRGETIDGAFVTSLITGLVFVLFK